ncbi:MAG TPA: hypothetical protein VFC86_09380, partial [Planctomycetota bacterium]|nr:hypothetical protein [Planctomycetota bacterium]
SWDPSRDALGDVEAFHLKHGPGVEVASVAFDVEGPGRPMRYYAGAHTPLIDATFTLRRVWGMTSLPFWIVTDEDGCIQERGGKFSARAIEKALGRKPRHAKPGKTEGKHRFQKSEFLLQTAATFLSRARVDDAVRCVREAESLDPECEFYRPQRLALAHPDRFYSGAIDLTWLKSQK